MAPVAWQIIGDPGLDGPDTWVDLATIVAAIATAVALGILVWQTRITRSALHLTQAALDLNRDALELNRQTLRDTQRGLLAPHFDATAQRILDMDALLLERPGLRDHLYPTPPAKKALLPPVGTERAEALAIAEYVLDLLSTELLRDRAFPQVQEGLPHFEPWIRDLIEGSEAFAYVIATNWEWYDRAVLARYADLANRNRCAWVSPDDDRWQQWLDESAVSGAWRGAVDHDPA